MAVDYPVTRLLEILRVEDPKVIGPVERTVSHPAAIGAAQSDAALAFCSADGEKAGELISNSRAGVVLCRPTVGSDVAGDRTLIVVANPRLAFVRVVTDLFSPRSSPGIHETAYVDAAAHVADTAAIGPFSFIGPGCTVGEASVIHGHVFVGAEARIGARVTIHSGTVVGSDGFSYERDADGSLVKFPHIGGVVIEDEVEVGANSCIDRGSLGNTVLEHGAKVDNLVHVAHNVIVGRDALVIANAMIGGSTRIGERAWIAPSATLRDGISIGHDALVGLGSVVLKDVEPGTTVTGVPARELGQYKEMLASIKRLMQET